MEAGREQAMVRVDGRLLVVVPRLDDGRIILLRRNDRGNGCDAGGLWELPTCPLPGHLDPTEVAAILLHRTTDYVPGRLACLGAVHSPAASTHCYLADSLRPSPRLPLHAGRAMTTALPLSEVHQLVQRGLIRCSALLSALTLLIATESAPAGHVNA